MDTMSVAIKTADEIAKMRVAGRLASELLDFLTPHVRAGVTTGELDRIAHDYQVNVQKVVPATLNYAPPGHRPYPASICTSVNHVVCHGIPGDKTLKAGDIVNIDVTVIKDGFHGDSSRMFYIGAPAIQAKRLCEVTFDAMWRGIRAVMPRAMAFPWCVNSAVTASAERSTRSRKCCITAGRERASSYSRG
jgi:methionyl aminopeptidase